ncbi:MAG TPA: TROVE domain-containing protein [Pyrinomonadaceae bacterium]|nr:TROVE domain-containing protein [Pyrinomonadaceae bacterium]
MANKTLFNSIVGKLLPKTDALNEERAPAYALSAKHALAQYVATGCMNHTFYASAEEQLAKVLEFCAQVDAEFIAKAAVFCRERGFMKDMPALLCAVLSVRDRALLAKVFPRVVDNGKMLRNFVQIMRSGVVGRKSLGTLPKRMVREWFEAREVETIFNASVGQQPSFADILKMVHAKPATPDREALYGYFVGRDYNRDALPEIVRQYEAFKSGETLEVPRVPFQMLTALPLSAKEWAEIARHASWTTTRMNLNTFARHGVFDVEGMTELIAERLSNPELVRRARVFPYQLMMAYSAVNHGVPLAVREALQDAMEIATTNVPLIEGKVFVFPDISGSMHSAVTGYRKGATTAVRCVDVAALIAATVLRKNRSAEIIPFESDVVEVRLNARDSVMTNAEKLAHLPCGGTNCSAPLRHLNKRRATGDLVIYVSDYESWVDSPRYGSFGGSATETLREWARFRERNPQARMVCIDLQPYGTVQAKEREDILNVGGFTDSVFNLVAEFAKGCLNDDHWVGVIEAVTL